MNIKTAIVTGASSGIGRACAQALVADGWQVAFVGRRAEALAEAVQSSADAQRALAVPADVGDPASVAALFETVKTRFGVQSLNQRMTDTADLSSCIDPAFYKNPQPPPPGMPQVTVGRIPTGIGVSSQPELDIMIARGEIPDTAIVDRRSADVRYRAFLDEAVRVGAVRVE